jgi:hypothetical protein
MQSSSSLEEIADWRKFASWLDQFEYWISAIGWTEEGHTNSLDGIVGNLAIPMR